MSDGATCVWRSVTRLATPEAAVQEHDFLLSLLTTSSPNPTPTIADLRPYYRQPRKDERSSQSSSTVITRTSCPSAQSLADILKTFLPHGFSNSLLLKFIYVVAMAPVNKIAIYVKIGPGFPHLAGKVDGPRACYLSPDVIKADLEDEEVSRPMGDPNGVEFQASWVDMASARCMIKWLQNFNTRENITKQPLTALHAEVLDFSSVLHLFIAGYVFGISRTLRGETLWKEMAMYFKFGPLTFSDFKEVYDLVYFERGLFSTMIRAVISRKLRGEPLPDTPKMEQYLRDCGRSNIIAAVEKELKQTIPQGELSDEYKTTMPGSGKAKTVFETSPSTTATFMATSNSNKISYASVAAKKVSTAPNVATKPVGNPSCAVVKDEKIAIAKVAIQTPSPVGSCANIAAKGIPQKK